MYHERLLKSFDMQIIHLKTAFRYRAFLTSLNMRTGNVSFASINSSGLINFVQNFPNLTNLRIYCTDESNVDINQILGVAPYLQVLKLYDFETITCALQATKNGEIEENRHLAVLKLKAKRLDIVSLKHIATKSNQVLTHVVNFRLVVYNEMVPAMKFSSEIKTFIARIKSQNGNPIRRRRLYLSKGGELPSLSTSQRYIDPTTLIIHSQTGMRQEYILH